MTILGFLWHNKLNRCDGGELFTLLEGMEFSDDGVRSLVAAEGSPPKEFTEANIVHIVHQILSAGLQV